MAIYHLSKAAEHDLERIFAYGIINFGLEQATKYKEGLEKEFSNIAENPYLYQAVDHIKVGYRRCVFGSDCIYYLIRGDAVEIISILGRQDHERYLRW